MGAFKGGACLSQAHIRENAKTPCGEHKEVGPLNGIGRKKKKLVPLLSVVTFKDCFFFFCSLFSGNRLCWAIIPHKEITDKVRQLFRMQV